MSCRITYGSIVSFLPLFAIERNIPYFGIYFTLLAISSVSVRVFAGKLTDNLGPKKITIPGLIFTISAMVILSLTYTFKIFILSAILWGLGTGAVHTALLSLIISTTPSEFRASSIAVFTSSSELGVTLGSILLGIIGQYFGFPFMYLSSGLIVFLGLIAFLFIKIPR